MRKKTKPLPSAAKTLETEQKTARTAIREKRFQGLKNSIGEGMPIPARSAPPKDEPPYGQAFFVHQVGTATPVELCAIVADSAISAVFTKTPDQGWRTPPPHFAEVSLAPFSAKMVRG